MNPRTKTLAVGAFLAALAAGLVWIAQSGIRSSEGTDPRAPDPTRSSPSASLALEPQAGSARVPSAPASVAEVGAAAADLDLRARLRRVAIAYDRADLSALESDLEAILVDPLVALLVLETLRSGELEPDALVLRGSVIALVAGVTLYHQPGWNGPPACRELLPRVLDALPEIPFPWIEDLVDGLVEARAGDRPVLGFAFLHEILALRAAHPDLVPVLSRLLEHVADELKATGSDEELYSLLVGETRDPTAVGISLSALLSVRPDDFLPLAEEMHAQAAEDPELAGAITRAIAASAPVDRAAAALVRLTDGTQLFEFMTLGTRDGALESIASEYNALVAQGEHPDARTMLVAGMGGETEEALLGIATTDRDARVRAQAFLTGSLGRPVGADFVRALRKARTGAADARIDPHSSVSIAENVLRASPGEARAEARELLLEIAADESIAERVRWKAVAAVKPWADAERLRGLSIGGRAVE